jgi:hypothetical protein
MVKNIDSLDDTTHRTTERIRNLEDVALVDLSVDREEGLPQLHMCFEFKTLFRIRPLVSDDGHLLATKRSKESRHVSALLDGLLRAETN